MISVLQEWVEKLPLRAQGTLLTGVRGCDVAVKPFEHLPLENPERQIVAFLRYCFMNPADEREVDIPGSFFCSRPPSQWKPSMFGHYPQHWYSHLMHCFEIIAYFHPDAHIHLQAHGIYEKLAWNMHLNLETKEQCIERLTEDRIAKGAVVS